MELSLNGMAARLATLLGMVPGFDRAWVYRDAVVVVDAVVGGRRLAFDVVQDRAADRDGWRVLLFSRDGMADLAAAFPDRAPDGKHVAGTVTAAEDAPVAIAAVVTGALVRLRDLLVTATAVPSRKVGILTLPMISNYGGNLQAFALMEALRRRGHQPVLINRRYPPQTPVAPRPGEAEADAARPLLSPGIGLGAAVANTSFIDTYMQPITRPFGTTEQLARNLPRLGLDAVIVGSDQVWRPRYTKGFLTNFFLDFLPEDSPTRRISYAASFGAPTWEFSEDQTRQASRLLGQFDAVSVREDEAVIMCRSNLGVTPEHVLDPTLLLGPEDYVPVLNTAPRTRTAGQVLSYILDATPDKVAVVQNLAGALSLGAVGTDGLPFPAPEGSPAEGGDKTVEGWLAAFHDAAFVVTDSFHGVAFSILFNKPFIAYGNPARGLARFTSLLRMFGLEERLVINSSDIDLDRMLQPVDWARVNERLAALRVTSFAFLDRALAADRKPRTADTRAGGPSAVAALPGNTVLARHRRNPQQPESLPDRGTRQNPDDPFTIRDVIARDMCIGCGACATATDGQVRMTMGENGMYAADAGDVLALSGDMLARADAVCPFSDRARTEDDLGPPLAQPETMPFDARLGRYTAVFAGRENNDARLTGSSSGGLTSWLVKKLLTSGRADGVIHVGNSAAGGPLFEYRLSFSAQEIDENRKSFYYSTTLADVMAAVRRHPGKTFAVVGVPCFVKAARLLAAEDPELRDRLGWFVGIVCGHMKSALFAESGAWQVGIPPDSVAKVDFRVKVPRKKASQYQFSAVPAAAGSTPAPATNHAASMLLGGSWGHGFFQPNACNYCDDVFAETADAVFGDAWLPKYIDDWRGTNVVAVRHPELVDVFQAGLAAEEIRAENITVEEIVRSQAGGLRHRRAGLQIRLQDDIDAGLKVPARRVKPSLDGVPRARIDLMRQRKRMSQKSFETFIAAKKSGRLEDFTAPMSAEIALYKYIESHSFPPAQKQIYYDAALFGDHDSGDVADVLRMFAVHEILRAADLRVVVVRRPGAQGGSARGTEALRPFVTFSRDRPAERLHELRNYCHDLVLVSDRLWAGAAEAADPDYGLLGCGDESVRRIAIAMSLAGKGAGNLPQDGAQAAIAAHLLAAMDHRSVADDAALDTLRGLGLAATPVLDPVFLVPPQGFAKLMAAAAPAAGTAAAILADLRDPRPESLQLAQDMAAARGLTAAPRQDRGAGLAELVADVAGAEGIVTDQFHTACLAVIFGKPFICLTADRPSDPRLALFDRLGLGDRVQATDRIDAAAASQPIDWAQVHARLGTLRRETLAWFSATFGRDFDSHLPASLWP